MSSNNNNNPFLTTRTALRPMPAKSSPILPRSPLFELSQALNDALNKADENPLVGQAQIAAAGVEATAVLYTAQASLLSATQAEQIGKAARVLTDHSSLLLGIFNKLSLSETERIRVQELEVTLGAALTVIRDSKVTETYLELARIATNLLHSIPVPEDDTIDHATNLLTTGLNALPPPRQTDVSTSQYNTITMSSGDSSDISTLSPEITATEEAALLKAEIKNFKRSSRLWTPPPQPAVFRRPDNYLTLQAGKETDALYTYQVALQFWITTDHAICRYQDENVPYIQIGAPHRPIFFTRVKNGPVIWGSTKRLVANAYVNMDFANE